MVCVLLVVLSLIVVLRAPAFPLEYLAPAEPARLEPAHVGRETGRFLWTYRLTDLMVSAFLLFTAAACCVAMLRPGREGGG